MSDEKIGEKKSYPMLPTIPFFGVFCVLEAEVPPFSHKFRRPDTYDAFFLSLLFLFLLLFHVLVVFIHTFIVYRDGKLTGLAFCQPRQETPKIFVSCRCPFWHCSRNCSDFFPGRASLLVFVRAADTTHPHGTVGGLGR